ncbi:MAG: ABC transporter substrate-binding protein [archaeon]
MKKIWGVIGVLVIALLVFGCTQANNSQTNQEKLLVGYLPLDDHMTLMVADANHLFGNTVVEPVKFSDWASLSEALSSGKIDGAHILNTLAVKMETNGFQGQTVVLSHRGLIDLVANKEINSVDDLKGKVIAVPSHFSSHYFMLYHYLSENGFDMKKDVTIIDVAPPDFVATLASGKIQAFVGSQPFPTLAESKGVGKVLVPWSEMEVKGLNGLDCVVVFNKQTIDEKPAAVQDYVKGIIQAGQFIESNPAEAAKLASPYLLNLDPKLIEDSIQEKEGVRYFGDLYPRASEYEHLQEYMVNVGAIKKPIDVNSFVNDSFAEYAYAQLGLALKK